MLPIGLGMIFTNSPVMPVDFIYAFGDRAGWVLFRRESKYSSESRGKTGRGSGPSFRSAVFEKTVPARRKLDQTPT